MSTSMDITDAAAAPTNVDPAAVWPSMPPLIDPTATSSDMNNATRPWVPMGCPACNKSTGVPCSTHTEQITLLLVGRENKELTKGEKTRINRQVSEANFAEKQGKRKERQNQIREKEFLEAFDFMSLDDTKNGRVKRDRKIQRRKARKMALDGPNTALKTARIAHSQELERRKAKNKSKAPAQENRRNPPRAARGQPFQEIMRTGVEEFLEHGEAAEQEVAEESGDFLTRAAELIEETLNSPENIISAQGRNNLTEALSLIQTTHLLRPDQNTPRTGEQSVRAQSPHIIHTPLEDFRTQKAVARHNYVHTPHSVPGSPRIHPSRIPLMLHPGETPAQQNVAPQEYQGEVTGGNQVNNGSSASQTSHFPFQRRVRFDMSYSDAIRSQSKIDTQDAAVVKQEADEDMEL